MTAPEMVTKSSCPEVTEFMLLTDAARMLGFSRQNIHRRADMGHFKTLKSLGNGTVYIVDRAEIEAMKEEREQ